MCKLFIAVGTLTRKQALAALAESNRLFLKSEPHGFGFFSSNKGGNLTRGHYLTPASFCGFGSKALPAFIGGPKSEVGSIGEVDVLVAHGRTSTNKVNLANVHPFHYKGYDLAHNGVMQWTGETSAEPKPICDTEQFLHWLVESKMDWQGAAKTWAGSAALALYSRREKTLTVARDVSSLYIARRADNAGWIMATKAEQLLRVCKVAGIALASRPIEFPRHLVTFRNGQIVKQVAWTGLGSYRSLALTKSMHAASGQHAAVTRQGAGVWERKEIKPGVFAWVSATPTPLPSTASAAPLPSAYAPMSAAEADAWKGGNVEPYAAHDLDYTGSHWKAEVACDACNVVCIECGECDCLCDCLDAVG